MHAATAFSTPQPERFENRPPLDMRSDSPLVLFNKVPPQFINRSPSPQIQEDSRRAFTDYGQLPKRTVSLGPKRIAPPTPPRTVAIQSSTLSRRESFHKMADELQSSLTELNKLIDEPSRPSIAVQRPPKYSSYLTRTNEPAKTFAKQFNSPSSIISPPEDEEKEEPSLTDWQRDSMNWKPSASINDLRSMFELKPGQPSRTSSTNTLSDQNSRPPRSASPSFLKNSPWSKEVAKQEQTYPASDYTIRRTISTSSRVNVRNPYRSHYGNF